MGDEANPDLRWLTERIDREIARLAAENTELKAQLQKPADPAADEQT